MPDLRFAAPSGELAGYLALPVGGGKHAGVVVIHDLLGLSDDIRQQADILAAAGYLALAPDLYSGRGLRCVLATLSASRSGSGGAYADIEAARALLASREDCSGATGIIGFCMGGGFALMCAPRGGYRAAAVNYGELPRDVEQRLAGACPIVASYGARDRGLPGRAARLERALDRAGVEHDVKEYPDAGHSFMNRLDTGPLLTGVVRFAGLGYQHASAEDAWRRIFEFFERHLRSAP